MNETNPTPKKRRAPRRVSVLFCTLVTGDKFFLTDHLKAEKKNFCSAWVSDKKGPLGWRFVNPFRSVLIPAPTRMTKELMKALCAPSPFIDLVEPKPFPAGTNEAIRPSLAEGLKWEGKLIVTTADERNIPASIPAIGGCCGGPCPCDRPRGDEPNNDNNITGPTC